MPFLAELALHFLPEVILAIGVMVLILIGAWRGERGFGLVDLVGVGDALFWLRCAHQRIGRGQGLHDALATQHGQLVVQRGGGGVRCDGQRAQQQHVARVQAGVHLHDGDAALAVTGLDGPMDGRSTAPAWQERGMNVQTPLGRQGQHPVGQDQAVSGHHHGLGTAGMQQVAGLLGVLRVAAVQAQAARLRDGDVVFQGQLLDGRRLQLQTAAGRAVGLGEHQDHPMTRCQQRGQGLAREHRRASKHEPHGQACASRCALSILVLMRPRLSKDRYSTNTLPFK